MKFRIFSHKQNLYTNSPFWPCNQRTWSDWAISPDGRIIELILEGRANNEEFSESVGYQDHDPRNFSIEPWTGYFDIKGRKIYRGDILIAKNDPLYKQEVIWKDGSFICKSLSNPDDQMLLDMDVKVWKRVEISGNIHGVDFEDS
jgi:hypothetical protein